MSLNFKKYHSKEHEVEQIIDKDGNILEIPKMGGFSHVEMKILSENIDIEKLQQNTFGSLSELSKYVAAMLQHRLNIPKTEYSDILKYPDGRDFSIEFLQQIADFFNKELALTMNNLGLKNEEESSDIQFIKDKSKRRKSV